MFGWAVHLDPIHQDREASNAKLDGMELEHVEDDAADPVGENSGTGR